MSDATSAPLPAPSLLATTVSMAEAVDPDRRIVAHMSAQDNVKTDDMMAKNGIGYQGYSGIVQNTYVTVGAGPILLNQKAPVAALLTKTTTARVFAGGFSTATAF